MLHYESSIDFENYFSRLHLPILSRLFVFLRDVLFFHKRAPQGGLTKKEIQLNFCNIFYILMFNEFYLFAKRLLIA